MGRRATDLATPVPVLGVPALVGLRGYKTLAGGKIAGPPPLPSLSWTQQCSIGVQTSPGVGKSPLLQPGAKQPVNILFTPSANNGTDALESFVAKELKEEGILQPTQSDRHPGQASKQRCMEAKTRKEVTFQETPTGTGEHREGSQGNNKPDCCYARAIKTNPHLAGNLTKGGPKPKLNPRYTNGSVVDSDAIGGISVEGADARPEKASASLGRGEQLNPVGGHCVEQTGEGASVTALQPFRTPPKICNQCGGKQTVPCGPDITGWLLPTGACPEGTPLNPGTIPSPTAVTATHTTATSDMGKLRDFQVGHSQQPPGWTPCTAGRTPLLSPNAGLKPKAPHPSCPVHSVPAVPSVAPLPAQTPTRLPAVLHTKALTVTEAIIETRQHDADGNSFGMQPHADKPPLPACVSSPPQFAIATKSNIPHGCSYREWTETSNCIAARYNVSDDGATRVAPSNAKPPAAVLESARSYRSSPRGPDNTPSAIKSTSTNTLHTDYKINMYTVGLKGPNTVNDSMTVNNKNMKNQECSDSSRSTNPRNLAKPLPKASLEMVMNTKNNAKTAMRPQTFPGSILHLSTTQVMETLSSYKQNNTSLPVGTPMHIEAPTHTASHTTTTTTKATTDLVAATKPFKHVGTPLETNPSDSQTDDAPKPMSNHYSADLIRSLSPKPSPITLESQIIATSDSNAFSPSAPYKVLPLDEKKSSGAGSPTASPELIEKPRSGHQSLDVSPHASGDRAHLTCVRNLDRPSHTNRSLPTQTLPDSQTQSRNGPAQENAVAIHHSSPASPSKGPGGTTDQLSEPLTLSAETHLAGDDPNSSQTRKTNTQHLHRFPANLLKDMTTLTVSDQCMSNHSYTVNLIQRDTQVSSIIKSCFGPNKDNNKCIAIPVKQNSKPHESSTFLKVTPHLNYGSRIKPQKCQSQTPTNTNEQRLLQLQGCADRVPDVQAAARPQVGPSEEEPCLPGRPARDDLQAGADGDARSPCSPSPIRTPDNLRRSAATAVATADSSLEESTGESSGRRVDNSDTLSSQLTRAHSSASSVLSQDTLDTSERELCPHSPAASTLGARLQRPWTDLTALAHLRSRVRARPSSGRTLVRRGPEAPGGPPPRAHAHPPDAEERLLAPSPRCSRTAALQWRLETVEASLEANRARISTLLRIIQDLEQSHASIAGCWCFNTGQDLQSCSVCQTTACVVYSVEYDFRQQEKCFSALLGQPSCEPPVHAAISPSHQTHNITSLRAAFARRIARSKVKSKKLCKTFFKLLPRKSQQR
ncbi:unnamed protein product [Lota lota]